MPGLDISTAERLSVSWRLALRAERKSEQTQKTHSDGVRFYLAWCAEVDAAPFTRSSLTTWTAHLMDNGAAASTARSRQLAVRRFAAWLVEEDELDADPFLGVKSPKLDERVIELPAHARCISRGRPRPVGLGPRHALRRVVLRREGAGRPRARGAATGPVVHDPRHPQGRHLEDLLAV